MLRTSATARTFPTSPYDLERLLTTLSTGEAVVTVLSEKGAPTPVAWTRLRAPRSAMAPVDPTLMARAVKGSPQHARYATAVDRESAHELLAARQAKADADRAAAEARREADERQSELRRLEERMRSSHAGGGSRSRGGTRSRSTRPGRLAAPESRMLARRVVEQVGPAVDVRRTGRIRPLTAVDAPRPRPPVITARALGETGRVRPLRPGVSIAHVDVSAGTLGTFVEVGGAVHALSNHHVLVGSPDGALGDVVVQPGPADGGDRSRDRVGTLAAFVPLQPGVTATVDAAAALLDDPVVDDCHPVGRVIRTAGVLGDESVAKIGRTTAVTTGRVTAIELDEVLVGYGPGLGGLRFDDQIEVESTGRGPFSRGGDSGSLVYRTSDGAAVGLLFAGSETGGENGTGLTYVNPIDTVLTALHAQFLPP